MSWILFTGTSSGFPSTNRACSSILLNVSGRLYQIDSGEGFSGSALKRKIDCNKIERIFISHLHPDHVCGLFLELQMMLLAKRKSGLDIYVPDEAADGLAQTARIFYLFPQKMPFAYRFKSIRPGPVYRKVGLAIYAFPNRHLEGNAEIIRKLRVSNKMQSYSFKIVAGGKTILYSGDIKDESDLIELLPGVHTAIVEGMHGDIGSICKICAEGGVKRLIFTHLPDKFPADRRNLLSQARKAGIEKALLAYDGMKIPL